MKKLIIILLLLISCKDPVSYVDPDPTPIRHTKTIQLKIIFEDIPGVTYANTLFLARRADFQDAIGYSLYDTTIITRTDEWRGLPDDTLHLFVFYLQYRAWINNDSDLYYSSIRTYNSCEWKVKP